MPIRFACPHCGVDTDVAEEYVGQSGPCGACGETITVPPTAGTPGYSTRKKIAYAAVSVLLFAVVGGGLFFAMGPRRTVTMTPEVAERLCSSNLRQIALAMGRYDSEYRCFPPAYVADDNGQPMHSWRVLLLPYLERRKLYNRYDFSEPWDGPNNRAIADIEVGVYRCGKIDRTFDSQGRPHSPRSGETSYLMLVGADTVSDGPTSCRFEDVRDGLSDTILLVECSNSGIQWAEPRDLDAEKMSFYINDDDAEQGIRSEHGWGAFVLMCDLSIRRLDISVDPEHLRALSTIDGGEYVGPEEEFWPE